MRHRVAGRKFGRSAAHRQARSVLELAAGQARERGVAPGDRLDLQEFTEAGLARALSGRLVAAPDDSGAPRILLVSGDRRFRAVTAALFTRRGWPVLVARFGDDIGALAAEERPDVALVDASHSLTAAAEREWRPIGVVTVSDADRPQLPTLPTHPKWGSFESLCLLIREAHQQTTGQGKPPEGNGHQALNGNGRPRNA